MKIWFLLLVYSILNRYRFPFCTKKKKKVGKKQENEKKIQRKKKDINEDKSGCNFLIKKKKEKTEDGKTVRTNGTTKFHCGKRISEVKETKNKIK